MASGSGGRSTALFAIVGRPFSLFLAICSGARLVFGCRKCVLSRNSWRFRQFSVFYCAVVRFRAVCRKNTVFGAHCRISGWLDPPPDTLRPSFTVYCIFAVGAPPCTLFLTGATHERRMQLRRVAFPIVYCLPLDVFHTLGHISVTLVSCMAGHASPCSHRRALVECGLGDRPFFTDRLGGATWSSCYGAARALDRMVSICAFSPGWPL